MHPAHRGTIFVEDATILSQTAYEGEQYILSVNAPECASHAIAGQFAHIQCSPSLLMRRPLSIMRVNAAEGRVDFLYKAVGRGTRELARREAGESLSIMGPIGKPFTVHPERPRMLLMGGGVGIPPMVFLAEQVKDNPVYHPLAIMGSEVPFPFTVQPSKILIPGMPDGVIASMPLLEDWSVPSRLASLQGYRGCYEGYISELARCWLDSLDKEILNEVEIFACGPHPMLAATAKLAKEYKLPCQVSLEEYMACAVGGCAGCVVEVTTETGVAMKRACVDGPVFEASSVF